MKDLVLTLLLASSPLLSGFGTFSPISGDPGQAGHQDGTGGGAMFNDPMGLARDTEGNLYVCDARNHVIRKISPAGAVTTLAGEPGVAGAADGVGNAARFRFPADVTVSPDGTLFVADRGNHCIRRIRPDGTVSTLAGDLGSADDIYLDYGSSYTVVPRQLDGTGAAARFNGPSGITYAPSGMLYVSDTGNQIIRRVDLDGNVVTLAGSPGVWGATDGTGPAARFCSPMGICIGSDGNAYIADSHNHAIRRMTPGGVVTTFAGNTFEFGCQPGPRLEARFCEPTDITPHPEGGFIICESFGNALFRLNDDGQVSLFAGNEQLPPPAGENVLANPSSAVCDDQGNVFVADMFNQQIRLILAKFGIEIAKVGETRELTITWDSLPGRDYQLQILDEGVWEDASHDPIRAAEDETSFHFPIPEADKGIYRVVLLGF